jgi:ribosome-associated toxin RatA of RatAB toxin-antitoxin module
MDIERSALVGFGAHDMYRLVKDVRAYPEFLKWCRASEIIEESDSHQLARLTVAVSGIEQSFTTRNRLTPGQQLSMSLAEGPFRQLAGDWLFTPLGDDGSKVTLRLSFEFSSGLLSSAFRRGFARIADHMVGEFCQRAEVVYGR